jgi:xylulokinase
MVKGAKMSYVIGLDIGTSGCKAGVVNEKGEILGLGYREYAFTGTEAWQMECDASKLWKLCAEAVKECIQKSGIKPKDIKAIALSVLGEVCFPVDKQGTPMLPGIHALDSRANYYKKYVDWWIDKFGFLKVFQTTSYPLSYLPSAMKIMWVRDNHPDIFERTHKYCTVQDFVIWKLTGEPHMDYAIASRTLLLDVTKHDWAGEFLKEMDLDESLLSPLHDSTEIVGEVIKEAAAITGLAEGTKVIVGGSDQPIVGLAVGAIRQGVVMDGAGSSEAIATSSTHPITSEDMMKLGEGSQCHIRKDLWLPIGFHVTCGHLVKWTRNQLGQLEMQQEEKTGKDAYDQITAEAAKSKPGAGGLFVLPHWLGSGTGYHPPLNPDSRGTILGMTIANTKADIYRAIFEGICFEVRVILESFEKASIPISELKVSGGGAKSPFWLQLKADITQKVCKVPGTTEASLLGAAMLAATGVGIYNSLEEAVNVVCKDIATYEPNSELVKFYNDRFEVYKNLYDDLLPVNARIRSLNS